MQNEFFSVVIPTFNSAKYIEKTLRSVFQQTYGNYEIIVSDDGSTDNTIDIVKKLSSEYAGKKIIILYNQHIGPGAARNSGIKSASSRWISFLDSDDIWFENKLAMVNNFIKNNPEVDCVCHNEIWKDGNHRLLLNHAKNYDRNKNIFLQLFRRQVTFSTSTVTIKKALLISAGMFDVKLPSAQDFDLWLRVAMLPDFKEGFIQSPLGAYINREGNISSNIFTRLNCALIIGRKYPDVLIKLSRHPFFERLRYEGEIIADTSLHLLHKGYIKQGIFLLLIGIAKWPFRFDWFYKIKEKIKNISTDNI